LQPPATAIYQVKCDLVQIPILNNSADRMSPVIGYNLTYSYKFAVEFRKCISGEVIIKNKNNYVCKSCEANSYSLGEPIEENKPCTICKTDFL